MEDSRIIDLYWAREEQAISETERKYGGYCRSVAHNILRSREDSEECVNDTWLRAWNSMPPQRPSILSSFLAAITRNLALDRYKAQHRQKRGGGQLAVALEELEDCLPGRLDVEQMAAEAELARIIDRFLRNLPEKEACVFLRRYWYVDSTAEIARRCRMAEGTVKSMLCRTRKRLRAYLQQEGVEL